MRDFEEKLREWKAAKDDNGFPMFFLTQFNCGCRFIEYASVGSMPAFQMLSLSRCELKSMSPNPKREAALRDENKPKNRYTNILPYDHSRVKLTLLDDDDTCDYINANYIPGYHSKREYIATQGPLESTVHDFWRMVWEQRSTVIVMLSGLKEKNVVKVHQYYPDDDQLDEPQECGCVTVTLTKVQKMPDFIVKTFQVVVGRERRTVKQFYIDTWRDFDATSTQASFWSLPGPYAPMRHLAGNTLSAGVGRTGSYIAIDYFMQYIRDKSPSDPIDIFGYVLSMRENRTNMVQTKDQYAFVHDVVAELIRRKTEVDRYDEPVYANEGDYANLGYDADEPAYANLGFMAKSVAQPTTPSPSEKSKASSSGRSAASTRKSVAQSHDTEI
nr:hypothetical protein BaRGS_004858 [Batillaria attramentaria]